MPDAYAAAPPVLRVSEGSSPVYTTGSPKATVMLIVRPAPYGPSGVADVTLSTRGAAVSMATPPELASEPCVPVAGSVRSAAFPARSAISPDRAVVL